MEHEDTKSQRIKQKQRNTSVKVGCFFKASAMSMSAFPCKPLVLQIKALTASAAPPGLPTFTEKTIKNPNLNDNPNPNLNDNYAL